MDKRKLRKHSQKPFVYQFFEVITGKKDDGLTFKKVICKYCQWRSVMNTTRMVAHIRRSCHKSPAETKSLILQYYGNGTEKCISGVSPNSSKKSRTKIESTKKVENFPDEFYKLQKTFIQNYENHDINSTPQLETWNQTAEIFRRIGQIPSLSNIEPRNDIAEQNDSICKYETNIISDSVDISSGSESEMRNETSFVPKVENFKEPIIVPKEENENYQRGDIKAFSEFVYYELETIKDLEIVNELKHDIGNLLYTAKKQYLQNKRI